MKLSGKSRAAFGFGAFGKDVVYMLISGYMLYYYNVVLGISSVFIGGMMMAARIFDALNDPFMGIIVAKTKTRWGRFRPWIFTGTVLNAVVIYALFSAPSSATANAMKVWCSVFYVLWGVTYTMMDIPFWSMIPAITEPGKDREGLTSLARASAGVGDAVPTVLTMVIVPVLGGGASLMNYRIGFRWWAILIAAVFVISEVVFCACVPEPAQEEDMKSEGLGDMFRALFRNDQAVTIVVSIIFVYTALNIVGNLILYFFQFDVGNTDAYSVFTAVCFLAQVLLMASVPLLRKRADKIRLFMAGFVLQLAGFLVILLMSAARAYDGGRWWILCVPGILVYGGYGIQNVLLTVFLADSVDYGEMMNGTREDSVIFSMQTFTVKLASGLAVFIAGIVIRVINLDRNAAVQSAGTLGGLRMSMTVMPAILLVAGMLIFRKYFRLTQARMEEITAKLAERRASENEQ
ncbi:MAG: glycoside-pentoside-hexuronide (GPH):cation symporter [Chordicoccus sp.]